MVCLQPKDKTGEFCDRSRYLNTIRRSETKKVENQEYCSFLAKLDAGTVKDLITKMDTNHEFFMKYITHNSVGYHVVEPDNNARFVVISDHSHFFLKGTVCSLTPLAVMDQQQFCTQKNNKKIVTKLFFGHPKKNSFPLSFKNLQKPCSAGYRKQVPLPNY